MRPDLCNYSFLRISRLFWNGKPQFRPTQGFQNAVRQSITQRVQQYSNIVIDGVGLRNSDSYYVVVVSYFFYRYLYSGLLFIIPFLKKLRVLLTCIILENYNLTFFAFSFPQVVLTLELFVHWWFILPLNVQSFKSSSNKLHISSIPAFRFKYLGNMRSWCTRTKKEVALINLLWR